MWRSFGGDGGTGTLLVRRGYKGGLNFDIVVGLDLRRREVNKDFMSYLHASKPRVLIISAPGTACADLVGSPSSSTATVG